MCVAPKREGRGAWEFLDRPGPGGCAGSVLQRGDVDKYGAVAFRHRTGSETLRSSVAPAGVERKSPAMVAANKLVAIDLSLAQKRALMRTASLESAPPCACPHQRDV